MIETLLRISITPPKITKSLIEIPLISLSNIDFKNPATTNLTLDGWMTQAREEDRQLGIRRAFIPYAAIYIPDTPNSIEFLNLALAVGEIPKLEIAPENDNQACWLKLMRYYWQAQGVILAHRLFGVIADPIAPDGVFSRYLPDAIVEDLKLSIELRLANYRLLVEGEPYIKAWAEESKICYPFKSPLELLLQIMKDEFQTLILLGPLNQEYEPLDKRTQRANLNARIRLLSKKKWLEPAPLEGTPTSPKRKKRVAANKLRPYYRDALKEYKQALKKMGWYGYSLLALLKHRRTEPIKSLLLRYLAAFRAAKHLFIPNFDWINGQPYQAKRTSDKKQVKAVIDMDGYIRWDWS